MGLSEQQVKTLMHLAANTTPDDMDCDGCYGQIAEFVEVQLSGVSFCESMRRVENHLQNCPCCKNEFEALKLAMVALSEDC